MSTTFDTYVVSNLRSSINITFHSLQQQFDHFIDTIKNLGLHNQQWQTFFDNLKTNTTHINQIYMKNFVPTTSAGGYDYYECIYEYKNIDGTIIKVEYNSLVPEKSNGTLYQFNAPDADQAHHRKYFGTKTFLCLQTGVSETREKADADFLGTANGIHVNYQLGLFLLTFEGHLRWAHPITNSDGCVIL
jgi:hypothetical protein